MKNDLPDKMKAIVIRNDGGNAECTEIDVPVPGPGEVLVKMYAAPINPSDLAFLSGKYGIKKPYPVVPGFEGSGEVISAGSGVLPKLWLGKKVACAASPEYNGCWAEYMVTKATMCVPLSKNVSLDQASMMFVNPMTALAFFDVFKNLPNPSKLKQGIINTAAASALGKMVVKLGKRKGIPVISIVRREEQVELLKYEGAEYVVNSSSPKFEEDLKEMAHKLNANIIFDAVGGSLVQKLLDATPDRSTIFIYGRLSEETCVIQPGDLIFTGNEIKGFWLTNWLKEKSLIETIINTRKIQSLIGNELGTKIHKTFPPEQILEAIETYKNNMSMGKVLVRF